MPGGLKRYNSLGEMLNEGAEALKRLFSGQAFSDLTAAASSDVDTVKRKSGAAQRTMADLFRVVNPQNPVTGYRDTIRQAPESMRAIGEMRRELVRQRATRK